MKLLIYATLATAAAGFAPAPRLTSSTQLDMSLIDDVKEFFSPDEAKHEQEVQEMMEAQKEILERRRDPNKMAAYHQQEEARHQRFDHKHDVDIEDELSKEWVPAEHPLTPSTYEKKNRNALDDFLQFFSKEERDHRAEQHHLEMLDIQDAEQQILNRRRDPAKMAEYKRQQKAHHDRVEKRHEVEAGLEFVEEDVLEEGQDFMSGMIKNVFGGKKKQKN